MIRTAEVALLCFAAVLAAMGTALANYAAGTGLDAQVVLTFVTFVVSFGIVHVALILWAPTANQYLFPLGAFLSAVGLTEVYRLSGSLASLQRWSLLIGGVLAALVLFLLRDGGVITLRRFRYLFLAASVGLLLLPLLPESWPLHGSEINGSRLWVRLKLPFGEQSLGIQPGEAAKVLLTIFLASYLADRHTAMATTNRKLGPISIPEPRQFGPILIAAVASFGVLIYQRDLGASLLLFAMFVGLTYMATGRITYLASGCGLIALGGVIAYQMFDHVQRRMAAWLHPFEDFADTGFQTAQSLFALGSGSLTGSGIGLGRPDLIPSAATDFIFAAVAEEMGLAGSISVIIAFTLLVAVGFGIALHSRDLFRKFLAAGLTLVIAIQTILIIAGVLRLLPVTGITLPFMSYGGSSLLANMIILALLARVSHGERR